MQRWMRRAAGMLLAGVMSLPLLSPVEVQAADRPISVYVNGQALTMPAAPVVSNGRTLVPLRAIFESLGATVTWDGGTRTAHAVWDGGELDLPIGADTAKVRGQDKKMDVPGQLIGGSTMVPLRFVGETLGAQVGWYGQSRVITVNKPPTALREATVTRVVDGDTIVVDLAGVSETVRLIGIDTPETVKPNTPVQPYGPEASAYTKERLTGQKVFLETDAGQRDRYDRLLAYVYLTNGTMFNATLVDEGYAQIDTVPPNVRYVELFKVLNTSAHEGKRGLWGLSDQASAPTTNTTAPAAGNSTGSFAPDANGNCDGKVKGNVSSTGELIYHVPGGQFYTATHAEACFETPMDAEAAGYRASKR